MATQKFTSIDKVFFVLIHTDMTTVTKTEKNIQEGLFISVQAPHLHKYKPELTGECRQNAASPPQAALSPSWTQAMPSLPTPTDPGPATWFHLSLAGARTLNSWWLCPLLCVQDSIIKWERTWPLCLGFSQLPHLPIPTPSSKDLLFPFI